MGRLSQMAKMGRQALAPVRVIVYLVVVLVHAVTATTVPYNTKHNTYCHVGPHFNFDKTGGKQCGSVAQSSPRLVRSSHRSKTPKKLFRIHYST